MADKKISELVSADALSGAELIETVQGGVNKKTTAQDIANLAPGAGHVIEDEGTPLTARTKLNFVGAGVTVTDDAGDDATVVTVAGSKVIQLAASDEITPLTTGTGKVTFRMPYAMTLTAVRASLTTAQTSGSVLTVDINDGGTTILSTKLTFDNGEKTTTTATTAAVISDSALADDAEITIDIDQVGDGTATGLKVALIGN